MLSDRLIVCSEEDGGCKDTLECLDDSPIMAPVLRQVKEIEHLSGTMKANGATFLADGESRYPDGDEAVLPEGKSIIGVTGDLQEKFSVVPGMYELVLWRAAEGYAAENERAGIIGELLIALVTFFSDNGDRFEMTKSEFCYAQGWQRGVYRRERRTAVAFSPGSGTPRVETGGVPKVFQKSKELRSKGLLFERRQKPRIGGRL